MLNDVQLERMFSKLRRFEETVSTMIFDKIDTLPMRSYQTQEELYEIPDEKLFAPIKKGDVWGGIESTYCWLKGEYTVPKEYDGTPLFLRPSLGGYEALLWVDNQPYGTFATKIVVTGHGNHYCDMIVKEPKSGQKLNLALEFYTGHYVKGCMPFETAEKTDFKFTYDTVDICTKNNKIADFYFDLRTLNELLSVLDDTSYRKADIINVMIKLHSVLYYSPENVSNELFLEALEKGREIMRPALKAKNALSAPSVSIIGHSHMDTAWLWHIGETIKKCARTFSNELNLMDQYDEFLFIQSSAYHLEMMREHYPQLFERIKTRVLEGRYEPNGGVWVECDCNITSGESMIRQFLWGQKFTQKYFNYTSNSFWLPDTFGYSASIPQIMKGCGVDYFLTTKMAWNDTNQFPYDTFYWKGIDGTQVFTHLNKTHCFPSPKNLNPLVFDKENHDGIKQKQVSHSKLLAYGFGDGGGGPQYEQIELARRLKDLEGVPKTEHTTVGDFMKKLEGEAINPSTYNGELYLELHRGTLTNQHEIKRNNRLAEIALHNLEYLNVQNAVLTDTIAVDEQYRSLQNSLLVNQFHDILPGTCITRANQESKKEMTGVIKKANELIDITANVNVASDKITVINTTSFLKEDVVYIDYKDSIIVDGDYAQQVVENVNGDKKLAIFGISIKPYSSVVLTLKKGEISEKSPFILDENSLETPYAKVRFNDKKYIESFIDKSLSRELCGTGYAFNTFLIGEDVPSAWDNWDVDADLQLKMKDCATLLSSEIISNGAVELRIRNKYQITEKSTILQDMIFYANSKLVKFETMIHFDDNHRFVKTAFDTTVFSDFVRQEIQFGYIKRPTTRNTSIDQAKFEVLNHKYTDLSEQNFGVSILNDSKYGISAYEGQLRLSLHKGGCNPDYTGDRGEHYCEYALLPHDGGFSTHEVIKPAYDFNYKPVIEQGEKEFKPFVFSDKENVIIETIKACEDNLGEKAFIVRAYEAEGSYTNAVIGFSGNLKSAEITNMLEEKQAQLQTENSSVKLTLKPFEIKTIKVSY